MKLNQRMPLQSGYTNNNSINNNNRVYNNLYSQNRINIINNNFEYSNQNQKINSFPNANNINTINNTNSININTNAMNNILSKQKCTCSKTGCRKKYCYCFSKGRLCDGCECKNCQNCIPAEGGAPPPRINSEKNLNESENEDEYNNENGIQSPKAQRAMCNCTKSNCMKKYCECFKQGLNCNSVCRCIDCKNRIYINNINDYIEENNNMNINNNNINYNLNNNYNNSNEINNGGYNNNYMSSNDSINNNNFYNYALHNNINNNIINNNIINTIPENYGKMVDYSNPINFQSEAFAIYIKNEKLKIDIRKINLNEKNKELNKEIKNTGLNNKEKIIINNFSEINETPKFLNKMRLRDKNDNSTSMKTCPTTNSSNKQKKAVPVVNKNIKKKKLQLN